ncbi:uncharacterized protein LOC135691248 [Rhopilema esculentum]|uniref:uncharacterized protein LOC135691248 n=1 Tax=Rhopilema esculentum TaxID=499914 RepID=UPI0031DEED7F
MNIIFRCFLLLLLAQAADCSGKLKLEMITFNNPQHRLHDGSCCDISLGACNDNCDNYFKIFLKSPSSKGRCDIGYTETDELGQDSISFGSKLGKFSNPLVYDFTKWEGSFTLLIEVWDKDGGFITREDDLTASLDRNIVAVAGQNEAFSASKSITLKNRYSKLDVKVRVFCNSGFLIPSCQEHCTFTNNSKGHYKCDFVNGTKICLDGWYGDKCLQKKKSCNPRDDVFGHYSCHPITGDIVCLAGWKNVTAKCLEEIDECQSNPCLNRGICNDFINNFNCSCKPGYTGRRCETDINECLSNPCKFGSCQQPTPNNYTCQCYAGYEGKHCEADINECKSNPCGNGSCFDLVSNYKCVCNAGYTGSSCEHDIKECLSSPCKNNATCIDQVAAYKCKCLVGFTGRNCETEIRKGGHTSSADSHPTTAVKVKKTKSIAASSFTSKVLQSSWQIIKTRNLASTKRKTETEAFHKSMIISRIDTTVRPKGSVLFSSSTVHQSSITKGVDRTSSSLEGSSISLRATFSKAFKSESKRRSAMTTAFISSASHFTEQQSSAFSLNKNISIQKTSSLNENINIQKTTSVTFDNTAVSKTPSNLTSNFIFEVKATASGIPIAVTSSTSLEHRPQMMEEIQYKLELKGDIAKWNRENQEVFKNVVCKAAVESCKYDGGCARADSRFPSFFTEANQEKDGSFITVMKLLLNNTLPHERKDATQCLQMSLHKSTANIEAVLPFAIKSVHLVGVVSSTRYDATKGPLYSSMAVVKSGKKNSSAFGSDKSKLIAMLIAGHFFAIVGLSYAVHWLRKRSALMRVDQSPIFAREKAFIGDPVSKLKQKKSGGGMNKKIKVRSYSNGKEEFTEREKHLKRPLKLEKLNKQPLIDDEENYLETLYI